MALDDIDMKRHSGVIAEFRRLYIKTGVFDVELSQVISSSYQREEVNEQIRNAEGFLTAVRSYLAD